MSEPVVVVIDDDEDGRSALEAVLSAQGNRVLCAADGRAGLELLAEQPHVAVIVLDLAMPQLDGGSLLKILADDSRLASVPVVVLSADPPAGGLVHARKVLRKPVDVAELLKYVLELRQTRTVRQESDG